MPAFKDFVEANPTADLTDGDVVKFAMLDTGENAEATLTAVAAAPAFADKYAPVAPVYIDFTGKADGTPPSVLDSGETVDAGTVSNLALIVGDGRLKADASASTSGAGATYYQAQMTANARRVGCEWVLPSGTETGNGEMGLVAWGNVYEAGGTDVPQARVHLTVKATTDATLGNWALGVYAGDGSPIVSIGSGTFTKPPADGVALWSAEITCADDKGDIYLRLPDNSIKLFTAAVISAAFTAHSQTPIALADLAGDVLVLEHFAATGADAAKFPEFVRAWADTAAPVSRSDVSQQALAETIARNAIPLPVSLSYSPTTQLSTTTTTSTASVSDGVVSAAAGPGGVLTFIVTGYYEFSDADAVFGRMALAVGTTGAKVVAKTTAAGAVHFSTVMVATGQIPGKVQTCTYQHYAVTGSRATLKAGGSGGAMVPPLGILAVGS